MSDGVEKNAQFAVRRPMVSTLWKKTPGKMGKKLKSYPNSDQLKKTNARTFFRSAPKSRGGGYFGVKRIGMTVGNPKKLP